VAEILKRLPVENRCNAAARPDSSSAESPSFLFAYWREAEVETLAPGPDTVLGRVLISLHGQ